MAALLLACGADRPHGAADEAPLGGGGGEGEGEAAREEALNEPPQGDAGGDAAGAAGGAAGGGAEDAGELGGVEGDGGEQGDGGAGEQDGAAGGDDGDEAVIQEVGRIRPSEGPMDGGTEVTLGGRGLQGVREIKVGNDAGFILGREDRTLLFRTPAGEPGPARVTAHFDDEVLTVERGFLYLGPTPDGGLAEWRREWWVPSPVEDRDLQGDSGLVRMAAVSDGRKLYVAVVGFALQDAAIVGYVDLDPGAGTGLKEMDLINPDGGELDRALSNRLVAEGGLGAELAFGSVGMWSADEAGAAQAGWRDLADPDNPRWERGALSALGVGESIETSVALPLAVAGTEIALCVRIVTADGRTMSNETLPPDNPALPYKWSTSYMVQVPAR